MARSAWQLLRELTLAYGREADRTGSTDEEPEGQNLEGAVPTEDPAEEEEPHAQRKSDDAAFVGCCFVLALPLISGIILVSQALLGHLKLPWGSVFTLTLGLVTAICLTAVAWWAGRTLRRRMRRPTEGSPRAGHTEDDQNSVGMP
ncbi:hypothetical protein [Streptomyces zaehneri]|uniref:hypothetical protein n=1 Tax=Streptomyces zaehneri TaxID=3051180 RepID=UPI0028D0F022|nr:hypothetical protein [Streptomyces sp. DSM 40713]